MKLSFKSKIYLGVVLLLTLFGAGIYIVAGKILRGALVEENRNRGLLIASDLAARSTEPLLAMDFLRLKNLVDETLQLGEDVYYAFILDNRGDVLVHTFIGGFPIELKSANVVDDSQKHQRQLLDTGKDLLNDFAVPVSIGKDRFGTVRIGLLQTRVKKAGERLSLTMLVATVLILLLSGLVGAGLARAAGRRVDTLHQAIDRVVRGDLELQTATILKRNCWDIMNCDKQHCPAHNQLHIRCWYLAGTLCPSCAAGEYAKKIESCKHCVVYKKCSGDEIQNLSDSFDFMVWTLNERLSEIKDAERTLLEHQHLLRTILDASPDFVSLQDQDSVYRAANKAFCEIVNRSEEEILGKTDHDLFPARRAESNRREDARLIETGEPLIKEDKVQGGRGERWIHLVKLPVYDGSGNIIGLLCSGRDITDLKRLQERVTQSQKMEAVGQLTAGIAHEINTPLGIILGYAQLLLEESEPDSQICKDLQIVEKQTKVCKKIVSDLLRFSRYTASSLAPTNVNAAIEDILSVVEHTFSLERVRVIRKFDPAIPEIYGDPEKLKQAVMNLLNNAFDAIGSDGTILIITGWDQKANEVFLAVADTGVGVKLEQADRIFDPFFTTKGVGKGTGLGLSVTFGIVRDHNGRIEMKSPLPADFLNLLDLSQTDGKRVKGSVFIIRLPIARPIAENQPEDINGQHSSIG